MLTYPRRAFKQKLQDVPKNGRQNNLKYPAFNKKLQDMQKKARQNNPLSRDKAINRTKFRNDPNVRTIRTIR